MRTIWFWLQELFEGWDWAWTMMAEGFLKDSKEAGLDLSKEMLWSACLYFPSCWNSNPKMTEAGDEALGKWLALKELMPLWKRPQRGPLSFLSCEDSCLCRTGPSRHLVCHLLNLELRLLQNFSNWSSVVGATGPGDSVLIQPDRTDAGRPGGRQTCRAH